MLHRVALTAERGALFINGYVVAAAFVSVLDVTGQGGGAREVWRYVEVHGDGLVRRLLYKGTEGGSTLGDADAFTARPETEEYEDTWEHGLGLLGGRIVNELAVTRRWGCRDFDGIEDLLLALNEITTIGQENARLTS